MTWPLKIKPLFVIEQSKQKGVKMGKNTELKKSL